ncbi:unnamed protein product [Hymenolepis diminuta]|uniref:Uncharacterized protein n=1 Tax=Hymenolepis diminuta TaxID=6216 RepID=A0A564Y3I6_HYMDI|nr:unnamed protein product [Hymenolepis diminuta]
MSFLSLPSCDDIFYVINDLTNTEHRAVISERHTKIQLAQKLQSTFFLSILLVRGVIYLKIFSLTRFIRLPKLTI